MLIPDGYIKAYLCRRVCLKMCETFVKAVAGWDAALCEFVGRSQKAAFVRLAVTFSHG